METLAMVDEPEHATRTRKSQYRYVFSGKHHGGGAVDDARWAADVTRSEEFFVFDEADFHEITDERGYLYGVLRDGAQNLRELGTWRQQIAEFPKAAENTPWHGYPIWAVDTYAPPNRGGQHMRPEQEVFRKMERAALITARQRKRLFKGNHA
jgi:hypothetical protein